jgi:RNA polymerase-binding transcription factor DksA
VPKTTDGLDAVLYGQLRAALEAERDRLRRQIYVLEVAEQALSRSQHDESGSVGDAGDVASDLAEQEVDVKLEQATSLRLQEVEQALGRLSRGSYGRCESCAAAIPRERLQAIPWARRCVTCASTRAAF